MFNTKADRGLSALNQAHNFVVNGLWTLPFPAGSRSAAYVLGGWQVSGIFSAATGTPFSATESGQNVQDNGRPGGGGKGRRPDWIGGRSFQSIIHHGNPNQYFDPTAFVLAPPGFYGNLGRNTFSGPGLVNFDISFQKRTGLGFREGSQLEFRADFFNLFNRANFALPSLAVLNATNRRPIGTAGRITATVTSSRQLQFGMKLIF